jgi:membrane-associated PAP2 superfamily phosphatase
MIPKTILIGLVALLAVGFFRREYDAGTRYLLFAVVAALILYSTYSTLTV